MRFLSGQYYIILYLFWSAILLADVLPERAARYLSHIKVVDACTRIAEPLTIEALGISGHGFEVQKAIRACEASLRKHPDDPHVQFLLARAYSKGAVDVADMHLPESVRLGVPEFNGPKPQYDMGYPLAKISCLAGDPGGCGLLGYYYYRNIQGVSHSSQKTYLLWQWACSGGNMQACQNLSAIVESGYRYIPKDARGEVAYSLEACMSGLYPRACEVLADQMHLKKNIKDADLVVYINYKACRAGFNNACHFLKKHFKEHNNTASQEAVLQTIKASCDNGNAKACVTLGNLYASKPKNRVNNLMASTFYESACASGAERFGCWYAGLYKLSQEEGVVQDIDLGLKYLNKACYLGQNSFACYDLANYYIYTKDSRYTNRSEGLKAMERSCRVGNVRAVYQGCDEGIKRCCEMKAKEEGENKKMKSEMMKSEKWGEPGFS